MLFVPFGLSLRYKTLDKVFNGITISIFGLFLVTALISMTVFTNIAELLVKVFAVLNLSTLVMAYILLKKKLWKIVGMFEAVIDFERKRCPKKNRIDFSLILFVLCFISTLISSIHVIVLDDTLVKIFLTVRYKTIVYYQFIVTGGFYFYWMFLIQFLFFEFSCSYFDVLKFSDQFISRYLSFTPNFYLKYQINEVIEKLKINDQEFRDYIKPLKHILIIMFISNDILISIQLYLNYQNNVDFSTNLSIFLCGLFMNMYFIITQTIVHQKSYIQSILINKINKWKDRKENFPKIVFIRQM